MLTLLLHMHQPDYRDPTHGRPTMPWVRLHATRGYRDIPTLLHQTGAKATINLVPSLLDQWEYYRQGGQDTHQHLAQRPADSLEAHERAWILNNFFHGHPATYRWFPAWGALKAKVEAGLPIDTQNLRDIQVWSNLAWFGFSALHDYPELTALRKQGHNFSETDKQRILRIQQEILNDLPQHYKNLPELSASPYYHPILPLLINSAHAQRSMPGLRDIGFQHPEDARLQLQRAQQRVAQLGPITGLWPSEGSVSPEMLEIAEDLGFRWFATDQGILERSEHSPGDHRGPWRVGKMRGLFRDRALSDRIGFVYSNWEGKKAAEDLLSRIGERPILLSLDGENPWESYPDAGETFLKHLLQRSPTQSCAEMAEAPPIGRIHRIHTGSWINSDFGIWIGQEEDQYAWILLKDARQTWEKTGRSPTALEHLLAAEGSDWFWWYGDDFSTPFAAEFDRLFRAHLMGAYRAMGLPVPEILKEPIKRPDPRKMKAPTRNIGPSQSWRDWAGAGHIDLRMGAMAPLPDLPHTLLYGQRNDQWVLRLLPNSQGWRAHTQQENQVFVEGIATINQNKLWLEGPHGHRLPAEGHLQLIEPQLLKDDPQLGPIPEPPCTDG